MKDIIIQGKKVNYGLTPFIIAEGGVNHNSDLDLAIKLIDAAAEAGADAIKFQTWRAEQLATKAGKMADYQKRNIGKEESQFDMLKKLELKEKWYPQLIKRAKEKNIILLSTPHGGFEAIDFMERYNFPAFKIASGDITNLPFLEYAAKFKKPMLISTGMSNLEEVKEAIETVKNAGNDQILIFHCTTDYPLALENVNLRAIDTFKKELGVLIGYSDHTLGREVPIMAAALGACMIEKHFTLDRTMKGPDHVASMEPRDFKKMVEALKRVPIIMGSGAKKALKPELQYMNVARKSIVAARDIKKGEKFNKENLAIKRPGTGLSPKYFNQVLGKTAKTDIHKNALLPARESWRFIKRAKRV
ncbi:N-acetylneuraminate synthase [Candidatus Giovannonibacteria bacterium RIFCSPLOWO2_01_FULL_43_160]|uniref:N-acetylneuraminate synthase n=2 Tax=Candidatus Giovannoniibacteriota TaxID=1752738 RepID=A0A0G1LUQ8_9BACT|nr:MAG: N-acetylneuraminate synthase [Candidatus Giovannonibacteria bacterium GW2011_GWB1_43_13]KKS99564.1 MAG: N-acetylneuraminate synthase [Candidatus Giovannonibacteria bacterium GW2011_GWA1_43_15]KKT21641.1 MAG: N-acetylneuraminate synthase [Candidatus Giovannonibacteria bacterium GW2011_GWC2_43_8]KKT63449.1 MAG: N-acetylneuraminate synthase [Candidatus Giovannonibacteria bacterium GW2011_GWA2_44_26]OGF58224.1 MAG: N-acetylneuraminate synthase [Candidatus Giovannonibacteria bacterium RIFCSP